MTTDGWRSNHLSFAHIPNRKAPVDADISGSDCRSEQVGRE